MQYLLSDTLIENKKPSEILAKIKIPLMNYKPSYYKFFQANAQFKAILHRAKRTRVRPKLQLAIIDLPQLRELLNKVNQIKCQNSLCCILTTIFCARINIMLECQFKTTRMDGEFYQIPFLVEFYQISFPTKTTKHVILITKYIKALVDKYLEWSETISYKEILKFIKKNYNSGTHICRRSGAEILRKTGNFSEPAIKLYGNWAQSDILSKSYLRTNTLKDIGRFWENELRKMDKLQIKMVK